MLDPIPFPSSYFSSSSSSPFATTVLNTISSQLSFPTLPLHIHELVLSFLFYQFVQSVASPRLSSYLFPSIYPRLPWRTRINWDVHVVSLVQSCSINTAALWVMWVDEERRGMSAMERVYGYTGGCGMIQGLAAGYFLWDLAVTSRHLGIFGVGMWAHAVCALCVFSFGFRPFLNFYGPTFILYELSSPFLNIHWFLDKLHLTGSKYQWYNGIVLLAAFFGCRLVWGTYQSVRVYQDVWAALHLPTDSAGFLLGASAEEGLGLGLGSNLTASAAQQLFTPRNGSLCLGKAECVKAQAEMLRFVVPGRTKGIPVWLAITYLSSNVVLNSLNFYWFGKMIETVRKRFDKKGHADERNGVNAHAASGGGGDTATTTGQDKGRAAANTMRRRKSSLVLESVDELERAIMTMVPRTDTQEQRVGCVWPAKRVLVASSMAQSWIHASMGACHLLKGKGGRME